MITQWIPVSGLGSSLRPVLVLLGALLSATVLACIRATGPAWALVSASFIIGLLSMDTTPGELAAPLHVAHLALLAERAEAAREPVDDTALPGAQRCEVDLWLREGDAERGGAAGGR